MRFLLITTLEIIFVAFSIICFIGWLSRGRGIKKVDQMFVLTMAGYNPSRYTQLPPRPSYATDLVAQSGRELGRKGI